MAGTFSPHILTVPTQQGAQLMWWNKIPDSSLIVSARQQWVSGGLTPCRQLGPSSRREHVSASKGQIQQDRMFIDHLLTMFKRLQSLKCITKYRLKIQCMFFIKKGRHFYHPLSFLWFYFIWWFPRHVFVKFPDFPLNLPILSKFSDFSVQGIFSQNSIVFPL